MLGSSTTDYATSIALDSTGNILVAGYTRGSIDGNGNAGIDDLFVVKLGPDGTRLWGNVFAAGITDANLDGNPSAGDYDAFVVKVQQDGTPR